MIKTWIITAYDEEAKHIINLLDLKLLKKMPNVLFYWNDDIVLAQAWIGKIQAAIWTTVMLSEFWAKKLINIWIAGNLKGQEIKIWDVFLVNKVIQHDVYMPFNGTHLYYLKDAINIPTHCNISTESLNFWYYENWVCVTWDQFIDDKDKSIELQKKYSADIAEMEAFSVAAVAREFWVLENTYISKTVSDGADSDALDDHEDNLDFAMNNSLTIFRKVLEID